MQCSAVRCSEADVSVGGESTAMRLFPPYSQLLLLFSVCRCAHLQRLDSEMQVRHGDGGGRGRNSAAHAPSVLQSCRASVAPNLFVAVVVNCACVNPVAFVLRCVAVMWRRCRERAEKREQRSAAASPHSRSTHTHRATLA